MTFFNPNKVPESPETMMIYEGVARYEASQIPRGYLGFSSIGKACELESWFDWRQTSGSITDGRILLLFKLGNKVEELVCYALRLAGFVLRNAYPDKQLEFTDHNFMFNGHCDGIIEDSDGDMILEIKSASASKFKKFKEEGVKAVYQTYYIQGMLYMHYSGLKRCFFCIMNKNDSSIYTEIVPYCEEDALAAIAKASRIIRTHEDSGKIYVPEKISEEKGEECEYCRYQIACRELDVSLQTVQTCRSCAYLNIGKDFRPSCGHNEHKFTLKTIMNGCPQWAWVLRCPWQADIEDVSKPFNDNPIPF